MKLLVPLIVVHLAMLTAVGGDGLVAVAMVVPEYIVGAAIGMWLAKHPFAPPTVLLSKVIQPAIRPVPVELLNYLKAHPRFVALASVIVTCLQSLSKLMNGNGRTGGS